MDETAYGKADYTGRVPLYYAVRSGITEILKCSLRVVEHWMLKTGLNLLCCHLLPTMDTLIWTSDFSLYLAFNLTLLTTWFEIYYGGLQNRAMSTLLISFKIVRKPKEHIYLHLNRIPDKRQISTEVERIAIFALPIYWGLTIIARVVGLVVSSFVWSVGS